MDNLDEMIIKMLKDNGRIAISEIARSVELSTPAVRERIRKLEETGVIEKYTIVVNEEKLGYFMKVFLFINIKNTANGKVLTDEIMKLNNVFECHHLSGDYDYLVKVIVKDTYDFEKFIMEELKKIDGIELFKSSVIFSSRME